MRGLMTRGSFGTDSGRSTGATIRSRESSGSIPREWNRKYSVYRFTEKSTCKRFAETSIQGFLAQTAGSMQYRKSRIFVDKSTLVIVLYFLLRG